MKGDKTMKIKLLALIALMLCFAMLFVSCGEEEPTDPESGENENGETPETPEAPETPDVPQMVVKPLPEGAVADDYFVFEYDGATVPAGKYTPLTGGMVANGVGKNERIIVLKSTKPVSPESNLPEEEQDVRDTFVVYDIASQKSLHTFTSTDYKYGTVPQDTYTFSITEYYFLEIKNFTTVTDYGTEEKTTYRFYTTSGEALGTFDTVADLATDLVGDVFYLSVDDSIFAIDINTNKQVRLAGTETIVTGDVDTFVKRPAFDVVNGIFGYVFEKDFLGNNVGVQIYDLTKWIDCIYSYTIPSYVLGEKTVLGVLNNGSVFIQTYVPLHGITESYDVNYYGEKYDIVYSLITLTADENGALKIEKKDVEFGYEVEVIFAGNADAEKNPDYVTNVLMAATDAALNVAYINPIKDQHADRSAQMIVALDNELNILAILPGDIRPGQILADKVAVGGGLYKLELLIGNDVIEAVVDAEGNFKAYLPENYFAGDGFIVAGEKIYGYDMVEKFDLYKGTQKFSIFHAERGYLILTKPNDADETILEYYYYDANLASPKQIAKEQDTKQFYTVLGTTMFVIKEINENTAMEQYVLYNDNNIKVHTFSEAPQFIGQYENIVLVNVAGDYFTFAPADPVPAA